MVFKISLYISLAIFFLGLLYQIIKWFVFKMGNDSTSIPISNKISTLIQKIKSVLFSKDIINIFKVLIFDILLQTRILKTSLLRWVMHVSIFLGFILLTLFHAMDEIITQSIFSDYASTLDPFFFLRNLLGVMVLLGIIIAVSRRIIQKGPYLKTRFRDRAALLLVSIIITSGFMLDSAKIISEPVYNRMVNTYFAPEKEGDAEILKAYWEKEYGVIFSEKLPKMNSEMIARGKELNSGYCQFCHSKPDSAFLSYPIAKAMKPVGKKLNNSRADLWLYYIHIIACFVGLAFLPFSKLFHIITNPITLLSNKTSKKDSNQESFLPEKAWEYDSCTNCGTCSQYCSVRPVFQLTGNEDILPANKLISLQKAVNNKNDNDVELEKLSEASNICTMCNRCTEICPSGLNLQKQWEDSKTFLQNKGYELPHTIIKEDNPADFAEKIKSLNNDEFEKIVDRNYQQLSLKSNKFSACIQCQTCSNVCPVVACNVQEDSMIDVTPHKIMNLLRMGLRDYALSTKMVWDCTTCYQCQENCPQDIPVADILYELKNLAYEGFKNKSKKKLR